MFVKLLPISFINLDEKATVSLLHGSRVVLLGSNGPKVSVLSNGQYAKFFRLKKWFSSGLYNHYANRFIKNNIFLHKLNIATVHITSRYIIPNGFITNSKQTKVVCYEPLDGMTVRSVIGEKYNREFVIILAKFFAKLHNLGVLFRAAHFDNIIYNSNLPDSFGLIDIDNIIFYNKKLSPRLRVKNFNQHILQYEQDINWFKENKLYFIDQYCLFSGYNAKIKNYLLDNIS